MKILRIGSIFYIIAITFSSAGELPDAFDAYLKASLAGTFKESGIKGRLQDSDSIGRYYDLKPEPEGAISSYLFIHSDPADKHHFLSVMTTKTRSADDARNKYLELVKALRDKLKDGWDVEGEEEKDGQSVQFFNKGKGVSVKCKLEVKFYSTVRFSIMQNAGD